MTNRTSTRIAAAVVSTMAVMTVDRTTAQERPVIGVKSAPPVVVSTIPRAGSSDVDAGRVTQLEVTFSKDMETRNFSWVEVDADTFPRTAGAPRFLDDKRTCVLPVKLAPGHSYVLWLNKPPYENFADGEGRKAVPYLLVFETKK